MPRAVIQPQPRTPSRCKSNDIMNLSTPENTSHIPKIKGIVSAVNSALKIRNTESMTVRMPSTRNHAAPNINLLYFANITISVIPDMSKTTPNMIVSAAVVISGLQKHTIPAAIKITPTIPHKIRNNVFFILPLLSPSEIKSFLCPTALSVYLNPQKSLPLPSAPDNEDSLLVRRAAERKICQRLPT